MYTYSISLWDKIVMLDLNAFNVYSPRVIPQQHRFYEHDIMQWAEQTTAYIS